MKVHLLKTLISTACEIQDEKVAVTMDKNEVTCKCCLDKI